MKALMHRFLTEETGVTAIEYGLIAGGIAVAIAAVMSPIGKQLKSVFNGILTSLGGTAVS